MAEVTNNRASIMHTCAMCEWVDKLPLVSMFINAMPQLHTGKTPYEIAHGCKLYLRIDLVVNPVQNLLWRTTCQAYVRYGPMSMTGLQSKQKQISSEPIKSKGNLT